MTNSQCIKSILICFDLGFSWDSLWSSVWCFTWNVFCNEITNGPLSSFSRSSSDCNRDEYSEKVYMTLPQQSLQTAPLLRDPATLFITYLLNIIVIISTRRPVLGLLFLGTGKQMFRSCWFEWKVCSTTLRRDNTTHVLKPFLERNCTVVSLPNMRPDAKKHKCSLKDKIFNSIMLSQNTFNLNIRLENYFIDLCVSKPDISQWDVCIVFWMIFIW